MNGGAVVRRRFLSVVVIAALVVTSWLALPFAGGQAYAAGGGGAAEYEFLTKPFADADRNFYVYKDFVSGLNHYTQKMWVGDSNADIPEMDEAAGAYSGLSGIKATLDLTKHNWGGYLFNVGVLPKGQTEPLVNDGRYNAGHDLRGAEKLSFYARGEQGGERVEFFLGGLGYSETGTAMYAYPDSTKKVSLGYVTLTKAWKRYEISLKGVNLKRIAAGFGWVSNNLNNSGRSVVRFFVDDIRYEFGAAQARNTPLFLQSYEARSPLTDDGIVNNMAYTYDNAVAAMGLAYLGEQAKAERIADALVYALDNDRAFTDGRLRNAYQEGDPRSEPGWLSGRGRAFARIPGFYSQKDKKWYEDGFSVSASTGNVLWTGLALLTVSGYAKGSDRDKYLNAARRIAGFVLTLKAPAPGSGFTGGYEGWEGNQTKAKYLSTEHNIDAISFFEKLSAIEKQRGNGVAAAKYGAAADSAKTFVLSMYDSAKGCFYTGTGGAGTGINKDVLPLDTNTWAILALGDSFKDGAKVMAFVEKNLAVSGGYGFSVHSNAVKGVWYEGTAQAALAYKQIGNHAKYEAIMKSLNAAAREGGSIWSASREGLTTGFKVTGTNIPWVYNKRIHLGAGAWLLFARLSRNPLSPSATEPPVSAVVKKLSIADKEWTGKRVKSGLSVKASILVNGKTVTKTLKEGTDYSLSKPGANKNIGNGSITVKGAMGGIFSGEKRLSFKIVPKRPAGLKLKSGSKSLTVTFRKVSAAQKVKTYKVEYRIKGAAKWKSKTVKVKLTGKAAKVKTAGLTLKRLKGKKTYEVRVYAFKGACKGKATGLKRARVR
jgi:hypothetical protein